jgi:hypothetical protein
MKSRFESSGGSTTERGATRFSAIKLKLAATVAGGGLSFFLQAKKDKHSKTTNKILDERFFTKQYVWHSSLSNRFHNSRLKVSNQRCLGRGGLVSEH